MPKTWKQQLMTLKCFVFCYVCVKERLCVIVGCVRAELQPVSTFPQQQVLRVTDLLSTVVSQCLCESGSD